MSAHKTAFLQSKFDPRSVFEFTLRSVRTYLEVALPKILYKNSQVWTECMNKGRDMVDQILLNPQ